MDLGHTCTDFTSLDPGCRELEGFGAEQRKRYDHKVAVAHSGFIWAMLQQVCVWGVLPCMRLWRLCLGRVTTQKAGGTRELPGERGMGRGFRCLDNVAQQPGLSQRPQRAAVGRGLNYGLQMLGVQSKQALNA